MKKKIISILLTLFFLLGVCACDHGRSYFIFGQSEENSVEFAIVDVQDYNTFTIVKNLNLNLVEEFYTDAVNNIYHHSEEVEEQKKGEGFLVKYNDGGYVILMHSHGIKVYADGDIKVIYISWDYGDTGFNELLEKYKNL